MLGVHNPPPPCYTHDMGTPIYPPRDREPGPDCWACTPDPWPSGATPHVIRIVVRGVATFPGWPPAPNGIPVPAVNSDEYPCFWEGTLYYDLAEYRYMFYARAPGGYAELSIVRTQPDNYPLFFGALAPCSLGPFSNVQEDPEHGPIGGSGYALDFPLSIILAVAETYNFMPDPRGLYHIQDSATPDHKIIRLAGQTHPGSALFKVDSGGI